MTFDLTNAMDASILSDMFKDAYGFRPRGDTWARYQAMNAAELDAAVERMQAKIESDETQRIEGERAAAHAFEQLVAATIAQGAKTREIAIRWLMDAEGVDGDTSYFEYKMGLAYNYLGWMGA